MKYFKMTLIFILVLVLLFFFFKNIKFNEVLDAFSEVNFFLPLVFLIGIVGQFFLKGYRWGLILKPQKKISLKTLFNFTAISFLINTLIPGKAGEPAKGILIARAEKIKQGHGLASVVLERLIDFITMILLFIVSVQFLKDNHSETVAVLKKWSLILLPLLIFLVIMFYLVNLPRYYRRVEKFVLFCTKVVPQKYRERAARFLLHFVQGLKLELNFSEYLKLVFSSMMVWLWIIPFYWVLMQGFDFGKNITLFEVFPWFSVIVASAAIPTPGMAGSLEMGSKIAFTEVLLVMANPKPPFETGYESQIIAYTLLFHFMIIVVSLVAGAIALKSQGLKFKAVKQLKDEKKN